MTTHSIGRAFENEVADIFKRWFPGAFRVGLTQGMNNVPDISGTPFWIEAKSYKYFPNCRLNKSFWKAVERHGERSDINQWPERDGIGPIILIYKDKKKTREQRKKYIRIVMFLEQWWDLCGDRKNTDYDIVSDFNRLCEVNLETFMGAMDRKYKAITMSGFGKTAPEFKWIG